MSGSEEHKLDELKRLLRRLERLEETALPPPRPLLALPAASPRPQNADPAAAGLSELRTGKPAGEPRAKIEPGEKPAPPPAAENVPGRVGTPKPITMPPVASPSLTIGQLKAARVAPTQRTKDEPANGAGRVLPAKPLIAVEGAEMSVAKDAGSRVQGAEKPSDKATLAAPKSAEPPDVPAAEKPAGSGQPSTMAEAKPSGEPEAVASTAAETPSQTAAATGKTETPADAGTSAPSTTTVLPPPTKIEAERGSPSGDAAAEESPAASTEAPAKKEDAQEQRGAGKPQSPTEEKGGEKPATVDLPALLPRANTLPAKTTANRAHGNKRLVPIVATSAGAALAALLVFVVLQKGMQRPTPRDTKPEPVVATAQPPAAPPEPAARPASTESTVQKPSAAAEPLVPEPATAEPPARTATAEPATRRDGSKTPEVTAAAPGEAPVTTAPSKTETPPETSSENVAASIGNGGAQDRKPQETPPDKPASTAAAQPEVKEPVSGEPGQTGAVDMATASRSPDARGSDTARAGPASVPAHDSNVAAATPPLSARAGADQNNAVPTASRQVDEPVAPTRDRDASPTPPPAAFATTDAVLTAPVEAPKPNGTPEVDKAAPAAEGTNSDRIAAQESRSKPVAEQPAPAPASQTRAAEPTPPSPSPAVAPPNPGAAEISTAEAATAGGPPPPDVAAGTADAGRPAEPAPPAAATPAPAAVTPPTEVAAAAPVPAPPVYAPEEPRKRLLAAPETWVVPAGARRPLPLVFNPPTSAEGYRLLISGIEDDATVAGGTEIVAGTWMVEGTRIGQAQLERSDKPPARLRLAFELRAADGAALARHGMTLLTSPDGAP